ncbi:MAG TPA: fimbrillin family protein [Candidatus Coprenecus pullistercoris]|nr:fimbrillin family protein [Candidatus Coprenecus pullistercoris]
MSKTRYILSVCVLAAFALASCTQDELAEQGTALPEGKYPITFSAVQVAGAEPQTRVSENADGTGSVWTEGDKMEIHFNEEFGDFESFDITLTVDADGNVITQSPQLYWPNTGNYTYYGMYCNIEGESTTGNTVTFGDQSQGLAYVLLTSGSANCHSGNIALTFRHALNKVRVKLEGEKADDVASVSVKNYTSVNILSTFVQGGTEGYIKMREVPSGDETYWEANVAAVAGTYPAQIQDFRLFRGDGTSVDCKLDAPIDPNSIDGGQMFTVTINVKSAVVQDGATLTEAGDYTMSGTYAQGVSIKGDGINLTLDGATINTSGIGINVQGGNPTIKVSGTENTITSTGSAGIYVAQGSTVTITGESRDDQLTVTGAYGSCGIGGYEIINDGVRSYVNCGNITIRQVTLSASSSNGQWTVSPGIGAAGSGSCGIITIDDAIVYAHGGSAQYQYAPGIGAGAPYSIGTPVIPTVVIENNSIVHAYRGGTSQYKTDYIGWSGDSMDMYDANSTCNFGTGGSAKNSTVYCYTGNSDTPDKTLVYDENGVGTEQQ